MKLAKLLDARACVVEHRLTRSVTMNLCGGAGVPASPSLHHAVGGWPPDPVRRQLLHRRARQHHHAAGVSADTYFDPNAATSARVPCTRPIPCGYAHAGARQPTASRKRTLYDSHNQFDGRIEQAVLVGAACCQVPACVASRTGSGAGKKCGVGLVETPTRSCSAGSGSRWPTAFE